METILYIYLLRGGPFTMDPYGAIWRLVTVIGVACLIGCPSMQWQSEATSETKESLTGHALIDVLQVEKQAWDGSAWSDTLNCYVGDIIRFNISFVHAGTNALLFNFIIHDNLPSFLRYHGNPLFNGHQRVPNKVMSSYVTWYIPQDEFYMTPGQRAYLTFDAIVIDSAVGFNEVSLVADYSGPDIPFVTANDSMKLNVYSFDRPALSVTKQVWTGTEWARNCYVDQFPVELRFACTVKNTGGCDLKDLTLRDFLGYGLIDPTAFSATPDIITTSFITWKLDQTLGLGQSWSIEFQATATGPTINTVTITANATEDNTPLSAEDSIPINYLSTNVPPTVMEMYPINNAIDLGLGTSKNITLRARIVDGNHDVVTVSFYNTSSTALISRITGVATDRMVAADWHPLTYDSTYHWYVIVTDGYLTTTSPLVRFTTSPKPANHPPDKPHLIYPSNKSKGIPLTVPLQIKVTDPDGNPMKVMFYNASDNKLIGMVQNIASGKEAIVTWSGLTRGTTYSWYCRVDDSTLQTISPRWSFTTDTPPSIYNIAPANHAVVDSLAPTLQVHVYDPDEDTLTVRFYDASTQSPIGSVVHVHNDSTVSLPWDYLDYATSYSWFAVVNDSKTESRSPQWWFTTAPLDITCYIKGGLGVNAVIQNTGIGEAADLGITLTITGGIFNGIHMSASTIIESLEPGRQITAKQFPFGLGGITVTVEASSRDNHVQKTVHGWVTGLRVRIL
jgi:hypothetical protein